MKKAAVNMLMTWLVLGGILFVRTEANMHSDPLTYRGGIRNSTGKFRLKEKEIKQVIESLKDKTGFQEIGFDAEGFMTVGDRKNYVGGSESARRLLGDAVDFPSQILLESHTNSSKVVFANLGNSTFYSNLRTKARCEHLPLRVDFSDFGKLIGPKEVRASFDLGITLLHELVHGVRKLQDSVSEYEELGDCEREVNKIRKELGLPERQQYVARSHTIISPVGWNMKIAELQFAKTKFRNGQLKTDEFKLHWDVNRVGNGDHEGAQKSFPSVAAKKPDQKSSAAVH